MKQIFYFLLFLSLISCKNETLTCKSFIDWIEEEDHGFLKSEKIGKIGYEVLFKPVDYLIALNSIKENLNKSKYTTLKNEYGSMYYFTFKMNSLEKDKHILNLNLNEFQSIDERLNYLSFDMSKDFKLVENKDTIPCTLYHYEQKTGMYNSITILLGFPKNKKTQTDFTLIYENHLNNESDVQFRFEKTDIEAIPTLKL